MNGFSNKNNSRSINGIKNYIADDMFINNTPDSILYTDSDSLVNGLSNITNVFEKHFSIIFMEFFIS